VIFTAARPGQGWLDPLNTAATHRNPPLIQVLSRRSKNNPVLNLVSRVGQKPPSPIARPADRAAKCRFQLKGIA